LIVHFAKGEAKSRSDCTLDARTHGLDYFLIN